MTAERTTRAAVPAGPMNPFTNKPEPAEHVVYYSPYGGAIYAALHEEDPDFERQMDREGRHWKKTRIATTDFPWHKEGGHDIGRCFVKPDGTLEVRP